MSRRKQSNPKPCKQLEEEEADNNEGGESRAAAQAAKEVKKEANEDDDHQQRKEQHAAENAEHQDAERPIAPDSDGQAAPLAKGTSSSGSSSLKDGAVTPDEEDEDLDEEEELEDEENAEDTEDRELPPSRQVVSSTPLVKAEPSLSSPSPCSVTRKVASKASEHQTLSDEAAAARRGRGGRLTSGGKRDMVSSLGGASPLDFSIKPAKVKRLGSQELQEEFESLGSNSSRPRKTKSGGGGGGGASATATVSTFPLDLSVKRPFPSPAALKRGAAYGAAARLGQTSSLTAHSPPPKSWSPSSTTSTAHPTSAHHQQQQQQQHHLNPLRTSTSSPLSQRPGGDKSSKSNAMSSSGSGRGSGSHGRQNPWQTQWINRSSEQTRDVFTCVWCKESFRSLHEMTLHMKESPRCGMAGMQQAAANAASSASSLTSSLPNSGGGGGGSSAASSASPIARNGAGNNNSGDRSSSAGGASGTSGGKEPMSSAVLAKNSVNLPRKLVRGQDVWLGRGAEQTRQILKCMWCGQSFKTLDEMTLHMRRTQHYTNIISQEQIISWRTPEDKLQQAQVNAVLTCKVCDEAFGSLKELSYHMVKNAHYKEHILRSITEGGHGRRRQTRERRKKSLPVRKLLELERMDITPEAAAAGGTLTPVAKKSASEPKKDNNGGLPSGRSSVDSKHLPMPRESPTDRVLASMKVSIPCDDCGERVPGKDVIAHLKTCKGFISGKPSTNEQLWSPSSTSTTASRPGSGPSSRSHTESPPSTSKDHGGGDEDEEDEMDVDEGATESGSDRVGGKSPAKDQLHLSSSSSTGRSGGFGSLSALESLVEKSFDMKSSRNSSSHSSGRHMQHVTQHNHSSDINSISQEVLNSSSSRSRQTPPSEGSGDRAAGDQGHQQQDSMKAVLTCKVCDESFASLNDLSYHMRKNAHYKVHILRSVGDGAKKQPTQDSATSNSSSNIPIESDRDSETAKELRAAKKEGHHHHHQQQQQRPSKSSNSERSLAIPCNECGERIDAKLFMKHLKSCHRGSESQAPGGELRSPTGGSRPGSSEAPSNRSQAESPSSAIKAEKLDTDDKDEAKKSSSSASAGSPKSSSRGGGGSAAKVKSEVKEEESTATNGSSGGDDKSPQQSGSGLGFINAIESLIERSFGTKAKKSSTTGILQRLGIDEEACPPWQHMASQAFGGQAGLPFHPFHPWVSGAGVVGVGGPNRDRRSTSPSGTSSDFPEENGSPCS